MEERKKGKKDGYEDDHDDGGSGVPGIPRQGGQAAASIHISDGGGGVKVRKMPNFSQSRNI